MHEYSESQVFPANAFSKFFVFFEIPLKIPIWRTILGVQARSYLLRRQPSTLSKTRRILYTGALLEEPFIALYAILPFILRKELSASAFEISLLSTLKPAVALFSFYWSARLPQRPDYPDESDRGGLFRLPPLPLHPLDLLFLVFPPRKRPLYVFLESGNPGANGNFETKSRKAGKGKNFFKTDGPRLLSWSSSRFSCGDLPRQLGPCVEGSPLFYCLLGLGSVFYQSHLPIEGGAPLRFGRKRRQSSSFSPWKESLSLKRKKRVCLLVVRLSLLRGGADALVDSSGALPLRYPGAWDDYLNAPCGAGFSSASALSSRPESFGKAPQPPLNPKGDERHLCRFCALFYLPPPRADLFAVALCRFFALRGCAKGGAKWSGISQAPTLRGRRESSRYSAVNVLMVGIRVIVFPFLGGYLCWATSPHFPFALGILGCLIGSYLMLRKPKGVRATA